MATSIAGIRSLFWNGLSRYASAPGVACLLDHLALAERSEHQHAADPLLREIARAASMPSMPGHLDVEDREVGTERADELDRLVTAARLADDLVALLLEGLAEVEPDDRLVLCDHDADGHAVPLHEATIQAGEPPS
jgi:hypothetical protein